MSNQSFIEQIAALVKKYAPSYGIAVYSPIIAQAILESASGTSELAVNAHNYFGLKYRKSRCKTCIGIYTKVGSEQNADGSYTSSSMKWCKFADMENGVIGYFDFINISNYANLKGVTDPKQYLENIKADGYATSLNYVDNLMNVISRYNLISYDKEVNEMGYTNSPLVSYTKISPNRTSPRNHAIDTITIHCVVGQCSVETLGNIFAPTSRQASSNYGVGVDGRIGMYVEEKDRSWCSSNAANDHRAITIEVASDTTYPYAVNDKAYAALIDLVTDICKRNGIKKLVWSTSKTDRVNHRNGCNMTVHRDYANKSCPGDYLYNRHGEIAAEVNKRLNASEEKTEDKPTTQTLYRVQVGAYSKKANADAMVEKIKKAGFDTYMVKVDGLYKVQVGAFSKKSNAENMKAKITALGFDAFITTKSGTAVSTETKKSVTELAKEVIAGKWGNGADRKTRLTQAGYDYNAVQAKVNELMK